jgi:hypothetical protein
MGARCTYKNVYPGGGGKVCGRELFLQLPYLLSWTNLALAGPGDTEVYSEGKGTPAPLPCHAN